MEKPGGCQVKNALFRQVDVVEGNGRYWYPVCAIRM